MGSKQSSALAGVCVENKRVTQPASLLQVGALAEASDSEHSISALFERECDMICEGATEYFDSLDDSRRACAASTACVAVVDHSANHGRFGLCTVGAAISRGSDKHEVFTRVCVERRKGVSA